MTGRVSFTYFFIFFNFPHLNAYDAAAEAAAALVRPQPCNFHFTSLGI